MQPVTIYTTAICPYCLRARRLLNSKGVKYHEIAVDREPGKRQEMIERSNRHTVPQIWIGDQHIGGCSELVALEAEGELDNLLAG